VNAVMEKQPHRKTGMAAFDELPAHWGLSKLGFESWVRARLGWKGLKAEEYVDEGFAFLATPNIKPRDIDFENVNYITKERYDESPEIKLRAGDVLLAKDGSTLGTVNCIRCLPRPATVNSSIAVITSQRQNSGLYIYYLFQSRPWMDLIAQLKGGMGVPHLFQSDLTKFPIPLPPPSEQSRIAAGLDRETARIDALIEKKTRFIALLKEKRQALITQAVTKGLDPTVPMKDSGVEWIGEVPVHWKQTKLRYIVKERGGKTPSKDNGRFWDGDVPWVTPKDMKIDVIETSLDKITEHAVKQCGMTLFEPGTILVVVRGMILAHSFPVAETSGPVTVNQDMKALTPCFDVEPRFLRLLLQSLKQTVVDILVAEAAHGTRVLRTDIWKQLPLFLPTIKEQNAIIQRVEFDSERVDSLVDATNRSIDLLKERRSALITAAVTGQIDLREEE
jgi:type I restriction enzyme S subunit